MLMRRPRTLAWELFWVIVLFSLLGLALLGWQLLGAAHELEILLPAETTRHVLGRLLVRLFVDATLALSLALLLGAWLSFRLSRRLTLLREGADRMAAGDLNHRLELTGQPELVDLADSVNRMARALSVQIQSLHQKQEEQEALLGGMKEGVLALDRQGRIRSCNPAAADLLELGLHPVGARLADLTRDADLLGYLESAWEDAREIELPVTAFRELRIWTSRLSFAQATAGEILLVVISDISSLNRLERLRREFVANVSHELKTPVTSIKGYVEALQDEPSPDPAMTERFLAIIMRQTRRLDAIIDDLLTLSRLERQMEQERVQVTSLDPRPVITALLQDHEMLARASGIRLTLEEKHAPALVSAQPLLLERAIINLLVNAIRYGRADSVVRVRISGKVVGLRDGMLLEVIDQGCGIAPEHLPRIFERFYVVDKARSRELGGTGLGLSIVKRAVTAQGGEVGVSSEVDVGSRFWIWLPAAPRPG